MNSKRELKAVIFDLDGVIVDTAKYHYLAWKELAAELGFDFTEKDNERLKGVSRMRSLDILLEIGKMDFPPEEKQRLADKKNTRYVEYIDRLDQSELLPGSRELIEDLRRNGIKTALGSASKNTPRIIERLGIVPLFDAVIDGNVVSKAKPDPEVFLLAAKALGVPPESCIVIEDAKAGIEAAIFANMFSLGIGGKRNLKQADKVCENLKGMSYAKLNSMFQSKTHF